MSQASDRIYFPNLDGLRFVAFFLVYLQHGFRISQIGGVGVAFFFVLSGFLITYLLLVEIERTGQVDVVAFYIRRTLRIWPLYFAVLAFAFGLFPLVKSLAGLGGEMRVDGLWLYFVFLANFDVLRMASVGDPGFGSTNVLWSVAIEEQFYLLWPLIFRLVPRQLLVAVFPVVISSSFGFRFVSADHGPTLYFHSLSVISDMAIGGLSAYVWLYAPRFRTWFAELPKASIFAAYAGGALFLCTQDLWGPSGRLVSATIFAFVVLEQNFCTHSMFKLSGSRHLSEWGRYTYGLYMLHMIVLALQAKAFHLFGLAPGHSLYDWTFPPFGLAASILLSQVSFHRFERPFLQLKERFVRIKPLGATEPNVQA